MYTVHYIVPVFIPFTIIIITLISVIRTVIPNLFINVDRYNIFLITCRAPPPPHLFLPAKTKISILSMCIVHSNHSNVIVGVFACSVYFILSVSFQFLLFYLLVMSSPAEPLVMHRGAQGLQGALVGKHCIRSLKIILHDLIKL